MEQGDSERLCDTCQALDWSASSFVVQPNDNEEDFEKIHELGNLRDVCLKTYCPLCRLVVQAVGGPFSEPYDYIQGFKCEINWQLDGSVTGAEGFQAPMLQINAVGTSAASTWPASFNEFGRLVLLADDAPSPLFFGRLLKENQVNFRLIKKWLRLCKTWHGSDCDSLILSAEEVPWQLPFFKVIDVWNQCVVDAPVNCKYVALSYVWGSAKPFQATKSNISSLAKRGSLKEISKEIPATIKDAMQTTSRLGERYLWVDSICIVQDDIFAKQALIANMELVFGHALLTIIAACGNNANAGLSGVRRYSRARRQIVENIRPGVRLMLPRHLTDILHKSVYKTRAWTYQERAFSKRCLFFTDAQVIFQCRSMCWREDIVAEHSSVYSYYDTDGAFVFDAFTSPEQPPHKDYAASLHEFSRRKISFDWDILNAFAGISNVLAARLDALMRYGIPDSLFDWALLWEPSYMLRRRPGFPSWSWAGWVGGVDMSIGSFSKLSHEPLTNMSSNELQNWLTIHTWIVWYQRNIDGSEPTLVWTPAQTGGDEDNSVPSLPQGYQPSPGNDYYGRPFRALSRFSFSSQTALPTLPTSVHLQVSTPEDSLCTDRLLQFWTVSAKFRISDKNIKPRLPVKIDGLFNIIDRNGLQSGRIWLDDEAWSHTVDETHEYEFIALSDGKSDELTDEHYEEAISRPEWLGLDQYRYIDRGPEGSNTDEDSSIWNLYNVMLIQWQDGIAERFGVGQVYRKALQHAFPPGPLWKEILLG